MIPTPTENVSSSPTPPPPRTEPFLIPVVSPITKPPPSTTTIPLTPPLPELPLITPTEVVLQPPSLIPITSTPTEISLTLPPEPPPSTEGFLIPVKIPNTNLFSSTSSTTFLSSSRLSSTIKSIEINPQFEINRSQSHGFFPDNHGFAAPNLASSVLPIIVGQAGNVDNQVLVTNVTNNNMSAPVLQEQFSEGHLCGVPGVCKSSAIENCINITLSKCQDCSSTGAGFFVFIIVLLGLAILLGNALIISASAYLFKKRKATKIDGYKASLAAADLFTGFQIFFVAVPSFGWTINSTIDYIQIQQPVLKNSGAAVVGGTLFLFSFTSSLYHLILLGITRLYAIKWPHQYRSLSATSYKAGIIIVWLLAALVASVPGWFPQEFDYDYYHITFLYLPSVNISGTQSSTQAAVAMLLILLLIPFLLMTLTLLATGVLVRVELRRNRKFLRSNGGNEHSTFSKQEISAFKTVAVMQAGFTLTLVPLAVVVGLLNAGYFGCESLSTPYLVCLYLSMTNSLVNVVVYSAREKRFRSSVGEMLKSWKNALQTEEFITSKTTSHEMQPKQTTASSVHSSQQL